MVHADPLAAQQRGSDALQGENRPEQRHHRGAGELELSITSDFNALAEEWRAFERHADCTVFQSYDWLAAWHRHIGTRTATLPIIIVGRCDGETRFILPLSVRKRAAYRELTFLGRDLGDYNAPLLAFDFNKKHDDFAGLWAQIHALLCRDHRFRHDVVSFDRMPERLGPQANPFLQIKVGAHPSSAYLTRLLDDWETFYTAKRSAATRRRDRSKRKKLAESGEVRLVTPTSEHESRQTMETLIAQRRRAFKRMGVPDLFARPGYLDFFRDIASHPQMQSLVHVSRLDVGETCVATNLGLMFRNSYYHVLASYDDGPLARFGPGAAHLHELMSYAIERGCTEFDFTVGDEPYKRDWCDTELKLYDHVSAASARGVLIANALVAGRAAKRAIKQSKLMWPAVMKLRAAIGALKRASARD